MLPVLMDLKVVKIYTFGVFLVLALFWSAFILWKNIRLTSYKEEDVFDGMFVGITSSLAFGRLIYILFNFDKFGFDLFKMILINGYPGISLYGCLLGAVIGLYIFFTIKKIKFQEIADYFVTPALLAIGIGKLGSFFSGSEIGTKTKFLLAIKYPGYDGLRHLTAFYEGALFFVGAYLSYKILFEIRRQKLNKGMNFYFFLWYTGLVYLIFDSLKSSHLIFISKQSLNFTFSLTILLTFTFYFLYYFRSFFLKRITNIKNYITQYGQSAFGKFYKTTGKKAKRGEKEDS